MCSHASLRGLPLADAIQRKAYLRNQRLARLGYRTRLRRLARRSDLAVLATEEEERVAGKELGGLDLPEEDRVVASHIAGDHATDQVGEGIFKEGHAV